MELQMTLILPRTFDPTHATSGLPGFPAKDFFGDPNENVKIDAWGTVSRLSGRPCSEGGTPGGAYGRSIYIDSADGRRFLTHFNQVNVDVGDRVTPDTVLGTICDSKVSGKPNTSHIHYGFNAKDAPPKPVPPADRRYTVKGPKGGNISRNRSANFIAENIEGWLRTHDDVVISRVK